MIDILKEHFSTPEMLHKLKIIAERGWGYEGWLQNEVIVALHEAGLNVTTEGKKALDADIVVNGLGIELRASKTRFPGNGMARAFKDHPRAGAYLFIAQDDRKADWIRKKHIFEEKKLGEGWVLIYVRGDEVK